MNSYREPETMDELRAALADREQKLAQVEHEQRCARKVASLLFQVKTVALGCLKGGFHTAWLAAILWHPIVLITAQKAGTTAHAASEAAWAIAVVLAALIHWLHWILKQS